MSSYPILDTIQSPSDLKDLSLVQLTQLSEELRQRILEVVSHNGGHLASSLGSVELTVALHRVFNNPDNRFVWDVGHQAYSHKLLTGRHKNFDSLRLTGGISGFTKPCESHYDAFISGHAGNSISVALGMAIARDMQKQSHKVVAILGDGSMACGMPFEAMNHGGLVETDLVVILNDNKMSISQNVGSLAKYLNRVVQSRMYNAGKTGTRRFIRSYIPGANKIIKIIRRLQESVKGLFVPSMLFEDLGFRYIGPIDGHNMAALLNTFKMVHSLNEPVLVHVVTQKGRGYDKAEGNPCIYHGTSKFDPKFGVTHGAGAPTFTSVFGEKMVELGKKDPRIVAITAAMAPGTGLEEFAAKLPKQFFDVGIAEAHAVTCAGGMAKAGLKPVVAIYSSFLQRSYDSIMHDLLLLKLPVVLAIDRAGFVGADGATHHGLYDIAYLRTLPNITIIAPRDAAELRTMMSWALGTKRTVAIRYPRSNINAETLHREVSPIELSKMETVQKGDSGIVIISYGHIFEEAQNACAVLEEDFGIQATLMNARFVKPLDVTFVRELAASHDKLIVTMEEGAVLGGFGSAVNEALAGTRCAPVLNFGVPDRFIEHGTQSWQREQAGLTGTQMALKIAAQLDLQPSRS